MANTRAENALLIPQVNVPQYFEHVHTLGKPVFTLPSTTTLDVPDTQRFQLWQMARENGTLTGLEKLNASPSLLAAMDAYESFLVSPAYKNWVAVDNTSRETQYRLFCVDVVAAVDGRATVPSSQDPTGIGSNPIAPADVGVVGGEPPEPAGETVTTGDPVTPDTVYGDDGSVVITF